MRAERGWIDDLKRTNIITLLWYLNPPVKSTSLTYYHTYYYFVDVASVTSLRTFFFLLRQTDLAVCTSTSILINILIKTLCITTEGSPPPTHLK